MKNVLFTGKSGFIGRNICGYLDGECNLYAPVRKELNLLDETAVRDYIKENDIDIVVHAANPNPVKNPLDHADTMFEDSIRVFLNLVQADDLYDKMYTLGSGAEYDKSRDIALITEDEFGRSVPYDPYGLAKFTMHRMIENRTKQCNLRIFACYGPTDHPSKFITHCIACCLKKEDITIRQDCYFDYMHVSDLGKIIKHFIYNTPRYNAYNICTAERVKLSTIAEMVRDQMHAKSRVRILNEGMNREYTGSNSRLLDEIGGYSFMSLEEGIRIQIESEKNAL